MIRRYYRLFVCLVCSAFSPAVAAQDQLSSPQATQATFTVSVNDRHNQPIANLKAEDFKVFENDKPLVVTSAVMGGAQPACIGILISRGEMSRVTFCFG